MTDERLAGLTVPEHRPGFFDDLAADLSRTRPAAVRNRRRVLVGLAAAVAAIGVVAVPGTQPTSTDVGQQVLVAMAETTTISATLTRTVKDPGSGGAVTRYWAVTATADGDFRMRSLDSLEDLAYDAAAGVEQRVTAEGVRTQRRGLAPGLPDASASTWVLPDELAAVSRALTAARDVEPVATTEQDRPAWRLDIPASPHGRVELIVDKTTGFPLVIGRMLGGGLHSEVRLTGLRLDAPPEPGAFTVPGSAVIPGSDAGFRRAAGPPRFRAGWLPEGFREAETAIRGAVVSTAYRRGLETIVISTRPAQTTDPMGTGGRHMVNGEGLYPPAISRGPLAGAWVKVVDRPATPPYLWAVSGDHCVVITGAVNGSDLVRIAESLR